MTGHDSARWHPSIWFAPTCFDILRKPSLTGTSGAAFVELYFILSSLFASRAYYAFGFAALTAGVVVVTTAMVSILFTYFNLCAEEYRYVIVCAVVNSPVQGHVSDGTGDRFLQVVAVRYGYLRTASFGTPNGSRSAHYQASCYISGTSCYSPSSISSSQASILHDSPIAAKISHYSQEQSGFSRPFGLSEGYI
jgi:hypothetical protein